MNVPLAVALFAAAVGLVQSFPIPITVVDDWNTGFKLSFRIHMPQDVRGGWKLSLKFSKPVKAVQAFTALVTFISDDKRVACLENQPYNADLDKGRMVFMEFLGTKMVKDEKAPVPTLEFHPGPSSSCDVTPPPPPPATILPPSGEQERVATELVNEWSGGFKFKLKVLLLDKVSGGWKMTVTFSRVVNSLKTPNASKNPKKQRKTKEYYLEDEGYNAKLNKCDMLEMEIIGKIPKKKSTPEVTVTFRRKEGSYSGGSPDDCATPSPPATSAPQTTTAPSSSKPPSTARLTTQVASTARPTTTYHSTGKPTSGKQSTAGPTTAEVSTNQHTTKRPSTAAPTSSPGPYNLNEVLHKSILFYEAERSGKLPANNRISYRGDSALKDKGNGGEDLTGGWYDAGDHVKFGFPMAYSTTVLTWGLLEYRDAYQASGELADMLDCIKWPLDYFIKAHTSKFEFYGQVGDGRADHGYWGRPEEMTMARPAWKITTAQPGSDLAAETAAAMAAGSIAFQQTDPNYAATLLQHAEELYQFADRYRGKYSDAITNARDFYNSWSGFNDELVWGAAWLYRATKKAEYLNKAEQYYEQFGMNSVPQEFSWDDKKAGAQLLLAKETGKPSYQNDVKAFLDRWLHGSDVSYTPKGLAWLRQWGPNRYAANTAFIALMAADLGLRTSAYREFAQKQIHYMLGDGGRSYVVGFGTNPPQRPHHRSSSCPDKPAACTWNAYNSPGPNPQVLHGALVGGPGRNDDYADKRKDFIKNEVANDYNAGFQSAVAGLKHLEISR